MNMKILETRTGSNYIMIRVDADEPAKREAAYWCHIAQCGKRVNTKSFSFHSNAELTMFTLRWIK
jgi:hypothetical protein